MPKYKNINQAIADNERKICAVTSCNNPRHRIGAYCRKCAWRRSYWGHPQAGAITKNDYYFERELVREVIKRNPDHEGIQYGVRFLEDWLRKAGEGSGHVRFATHAARLYDHGVKGLDLLIELSSIYLLSCWFHTKVKDNNHLTYLLGSKFIRFKRYKGRTTGTEHRKIGEYLRENIGVLFVTISQAAEKLEEKRNQGVRAMNQPLEIDQKEVTHGE